MPTGIESNAAREPGRLPIWLGLCFFLAIAGFFLWEEHRAHLARAVTDLDIPAFRFEGAGHDRREGEMTTCECAVTHERRRIVLTGGPGAGKTALLELVRQSFCRHVKALPEAASVVFGGGFPREDDPACRCAAQRAIFHVQRELEVTGDRHNAAIVLCDRRTVDGLAYWPGPPEEFWSSLGTTLDSELNRYDAVIHLRTPALAHGYNRQNPLRTESAARASEIDARIANAWALHPRRLVVESSSDFLDKAARALEILRAEMPDCCKRHVVPAIRDRYKAGA